MPNTKVEKLIFGILMSFFMVYGMETYNTALLDSFNHINFLMDVKEWILLSSIVFIIENVYGGRISKKLAFRFIKKDRGRQIINIVIIQLCTICIMCPSMSLVACIMFKEGVRHGIQYFLITWLKTILINLPMATIWQIVVCGPCVRYINQAIVVPLENKAIVH